MKVVQLNCTYGNQDSTGRNVMELHRYFLNLGIDSHVFASVIHENESNETVHLFSSKLDRNVHAVCSRIFGRQGFFSVYSTWKLIKNLKDICPDVVLLHVLHSNCINFPMLFNFLSDNKVAVILVLHDCWYYTGHCCHYVEDYCTEWTRNCHKCRSLKKWNKSYFFDNASKNLLSKKQWYNSIERLAVIGVSDWITNEAKKSILKDAKIIDRIYNWVDLSIFYPQSKNLIRQKYGFNFSRKILLGVASVWSDRKGLAEMLDAAVNFEDCDVVLIGKVPESCKFPNNIHVVGEIRNPEVLAEYYAMSDVFLNPSVQETFGKTTAEALACGVPVVVYNTTACAELVPEGCGKVVPFRNKAAYLAGVKEVLTNSAEDYTKQCRMHAVSNFSAEQCLLHYHTVIENVVYL